jgi:hypothetical protein
MKFKLTPQFVLTFLALTFVMHEAHEIVHTSIGRLICGCWGERDFNGWGLCNGCFEQNPISILATFAGPIFTFIMIWIGTFLIGQDKSDRQKVMGFSLIFANMPFARILTAAIGGGDEVWGLNQLLKNHPLAWTIGLLLILAITIIPLVKSFKLIANKRKIGWFLLFFLAPTFIDLLVVLGVMNTLLEKGVLSDYWILGSPIIVTAWTVFVTGLFFLTKNNIYKLTGK